MAPLVSVSSLALKYLLVVSSPWLAGAAAVGFLSGRQSVENAARRGREARRQAEMARLLADNRALLAGLDRLQALAAPHDALSLPKGEEPRATPQAPPSPARDPTKISFLKRLLQANLKLREVPQNNPGETRHG